MNVVLALIRLRSLKMVQLPLPNNLTIEITAEDIKNGKPGSCASCPIALAVKRLITNSYKVRVNTYFIEILKKHGTVIKKYLLPIKTRNFIMDFDKGGYDLEPFTFETHSYIQGLLK